jgi:phospho-N-acetylmuramoyl-pentapeptide-transferase
MHIDIGTVYFVFYFFVVMLTKFNVLIVYGLIAMLIAVVAYPYYIRLLQYLKAGKNIREHDATGNKSEIFVQLHQHKSGTPTMGWGLLLLIVMIMILGSFVIQQWWRTNNVLINRSETYIVIFGLFAMGIIWLIDDVLNISSYGAIKGLSAKAKMIGFIIFSSFISYRFYYKLGVQTVNLRPIYGTVDIGIWYPILTFVFTIAIVNAINITDGLDWLAWGLLIMILGVLGVMTFVYSRYLTTTIIAIVCGALFGFLRFNINPAKIFMGDSGALWLGWLVSTLIYLLGIKMGIIIPFMICFAIFWVEISSSFLQLSRKKIWKKKLFTVAPMHHYLEWKGYSETHIVMKLWLIQGILCTITLILLFYQMQS